MLVGTYVPLPVKNNSELAIYRCKLSALATFWPMLNNKPDVKIRPPIDRPGSSWLVEWVVYI